MTRRHIPLGGDVELEAFIDEEVANSGSSSVGDSYLTATTVDAEAIASGFGGLNVPFTLAHSAGTDVAIDGGDPTKVNVATAGWYSMSFEWSLQADDADILRSEVRVSASVTAIPRAFIDGRGGPRSVGVITTPPIHLDAGAVIGVFAFAITTDATAYSFFGDHDRFGIYRLA